MIEELSGKLGEKIYIKTFSRIEVGSWNDQGST
jgi:hypothetical protein